MLLALEASLARRRLVRVEPTVVVDSGTDWLTPVATLLAVVVGGGITWLVQRFEAQRQELGQAKAAARVVQGDLAIQASHLKDMVEDDPHWYGFHDLTLDNWPDRQGTLALQLDHTQWETVSQSALELAHLSDGFRKAFAPGGPHEGKGRLPLSDAQRKKLRVMWNNATAAYNELAHLAGIAPVDGLLHQTTVPSGPRSDSAPASGPSSATL